MSASVYPALPIDPRAVDRLERYLVTSARLRALDPLAHQRRFLHGLYILARMRRLPSRFVRSATPAPVVNINQARPRALRSKA